jgi:hypothetical protein
VWKRWKTRTANVFLTKVEEFDEETAMDTEPPVVLDQDGMKVWRGEIHKEDENGDVDRSASLLLIGRVLYDAGAMQRTVVEALKESILRRNCSRTLMS